jgi:hypothetical protein
LGDYLYFPKISLILIYQKSIIMKVVIFLYVFTFACLFNAQASTPPTPKSKIQTLPTQQAQTHAQPKDCVKHPQIVKANPTATAKVTAEKPKLASNDKVVKIIPIQKPLNTVPHFSVLNFINFFYTKDTLDNLHVM